MYRPKPKLTKVIATTLALATSGCYGLVADVMDKAGGYSNDSITRDASGIVGRAVRREGEKVKSKKERRADLEFELESVRKHRELENELDGYSPTRESQYDEATQGALSKVFGRDKSDSIDYRAVINEVEKSCKENPFDYERNVRTVDNALSLEGLTSDDKRRLIGILEDRISNQGIYNQITKLKKARIPIDHNKHIELIKGRLIISDYLIRSSETSTISRIWSLKLHQGRILKYFQFERPSDNTAIPYLRDKLNTLEEVEKNIQLSQKESKLLNRSYESIEKLLRKRLARQDSQFKSKIQKIKATIKSSNQLLKEGSTTEARDIFGQEIIKTAREIGYISPIRSQLRKLKKF